VNWRADLTGRTSDVSSEGGPLQPLGPYGATTKFWFKYYANFQTRHTLSFEFKKDKWTYIAGVQNLTDEHPPAISSGGFRRGTAALNQYDFLGRRVFFELNRKF
jgi:iron complex outermembrane receptor protein